MKLDILLMSPTLFENQEDASSETRDSLINMLKTNCKQYLKDNLSDLINEEYFARNMDVNNQFGIKETRVNRRLRDTKQGFSKPLEQYFIDTFKKNYRTENVLFAYRSKSDRLAEYNEYLTLVIPIDGTKMVASKDVSDYYIMIQNPMRNVPIFTKRMNCAKVLKKCLGDELVKKTFAEINEQTKEKKMRLLSAIYINLFAAETGEFDKQALIDSLKEQQFSFLDEKIPYEISNTVEDKVDYLMTEMIKVMNYKEMPAKPTFVPRNCECMIDTNKYFYYVLNIASDVHNADKYKFFIECAKEAIKD